MLVATCVDFEYMYIEIRKKDRYFFLKKITAIQKQMHVSGDCIFGNSNNSKVFEQIYFKVQQTNSGQQSTEV